jgi:hypothetical protein
MDPLTIALLVGAFWLSGLAALVSICRAAAHGDRFLRAREGRSGAPGDSHERSLAG